MKGADPGLLDLLACRGVAINAQNSKGDTPLSIAAQYGRADLISILLQYGICKEKIVPHQPFKIATLLQGQMLILLTNQDVYQLTLQAAMVYIHLLEYCHLCT